MVVCSFYDILPFMIIGGLNKVICFFMDFGRRARFRYKYKFEIQKCTLKSNFFTLKELNSTMTLNFTF